MRRATLVVFVLFCSLLGGCGKFGSAFHRSTLPDMGPPLPVTVRLAFDPSLTTAMAQYADACNHPQELHIGSELEDALIDAAHQTFQTVYLAGRVPADAQIDVDVSVTLQQSGLQIQTDGVYDRLPTELTLESLAVFRDKSGKVLGERTLKTSRREKIILEPTQKRCAYVTMDPFLHDTAVVLATQFMREARGVFEPSTPVAAAAPPVPASGMATGKSPSTPAVQPTPESVKSPVVTATAPSVSPSIADGVDRLPTRPAGFQQPQTYVIAVGISSHRDPQVSPRKYASLDA